MRTPSLLSSDSSHISHSQSKRFVQMDRFIRGTSRCHISSELKLKDHFILDEKLEEFLSKFSSRFTWNLAKWKTYRLNDALGENSLPFLMAKNEKSPEWRKVSEISSVS